VLSSATCGSMKFLIIFLAFVAVTFPKNNEERCICGLAKRINFGKTSDAENRIIGGEKAEVNEYPWMVRVKTGIFTCGGSLISDSWILTAAHCVNIGKTSAYLGEHNTKLKIETRDLTLRVNADPENTIIHPLWSKLRLNFYMEYLFNPLIEQSLVKLPLCFF